jgi:hypothetical protein
MEMELDHGPRTPGPAGGRDRQLATLERLLAIKATEVTGRAHRGCRVGSGGLGGRQGGRVPVRSLH